MKKIWGIVSLLCLLLLCCTGCMPDAPRQNNEPVEHPSGDVVYVVNGSIRTTSTWNMEYGAVTADGRMVLPFDHRQIMEIRDVETGEQLWLQSYEVLVKDGAAVSEEMMQDYYEGLYTDADWKYFEQHYLLYDLEGNLLEDLGACGIRRVCGDFVLYQDNRLVYKPTGEVLFDDCVTVNPGEDCYIISYDQYKRVCVMNQNLEILLDIEGHDGFTDSDGRYLLITTKNTASGEKQGLCRIDGTQIVPEEYDYFVTYYSIQTPYVQAVNDGIISVLALEDGREIYRTADEYEYVQELFEDCMVIQTRYEVEQSGVSWPVYEYRSQLYDYNGRPAGRAYESLSSQTDLYERTLRKTGEGVLRFVVSDGTGSRYLIDEKGRVLYTAVDGEWITVLTEDRIIVNGHDGKGDVLCSLDGQVLNQKTYENINCLYLMEKGSYYNQSELAVGWYTYNNMQLADVLDCDGNIIIERAKNVNMLAENLFWVEKGFSQGLMDAEGNWIYEQSLFNSAVDE